MKKISIVIATYTGEDHIADCFESIVSQVDLGGLREIVVVIDGPNEKIFNICTRYTEIFQDKGIVFLVEQFAENKGRFEARYTGAMRASEEFLLFIDDRTMMDVNYMQEVSMVPGEARAFISSIKESSQPNAASKALYYVRKSIYKNWGHDFEPHYITHSNFESEAKGAAGMMVERELFINACEQFKSETVDTENSSDDTKLLRIIVDDTPIYKTPRLILSYEPRQGLWDELTHVYQRGPKFIDYYLKPSSRYFLPLLLFLLGLAATVIVTVLAWWVGLSFVIFALLVLLIGSFVITRKVVEAGLVFMGAVLLVIFFGTGLVVGVVRRFSRKSNE